MKNTFKFYAACWAVLLALYNVVVFAVRALPGFAITYDARFWFAWAATMVCFVGQLVCAFFAFRAKNKEAMFLNIPLITGSYTALVTMTVLGGICMLIPDCPAWVTAIVCTLVLGFSAISVLKAAAAAQAVTDVEQRVKENTLFIRLLTADAENLLARAQTPETKAALQKVYQTIRYSDPMSHPALGGIEAEITLQFEVLTNAVAQNDTAAIVDAAQQVVLLVGDRSRKCLVLK